MSGSGRRRASGAATAAGVVLALGTVLAAGVLAAQSLSVERVVHLTVTDPLNRFVAGLAPEHFEIIENGVRRAITGVANPDSPISIAIVSDAPLPADVVMAGGEGEVTEARSVAEAVQQLAASKNTRKALLLLSRPEEKQSIPGGIFAMRTEAGNVRRAVVELRNQYVLRFESAAPSAAVEVVVKAPPGLPVLKAHWQ